MKTFCKAVLASLFALFLFNNDCDERPGRPGLGTAGVLRHYQKSRKVLFLLRAWYSHNSSPHLLHGALVWDVLVIQSWTTSKREAARVCVWV